MPRSTEVLAPSSPMIASDRSGLRSTRRRPSRFVVLSGLSLLIAVSRVGDLDIAETIALVAALRCLHSRLVVTASNMLAAFLILFFVVGPRVLQLDVSLGLDGAMYGVACWIGLCVGRRHAQGALRVIETRIVPSGSSNLLQAVVLGGYSICLAALVAQHGPSGLLRGDVHVARLAAAGRTGGGVGGPLESALALLAMLGVAWFAASCWEHWEKRSRPPLAWVRGAYCTSSLVVQ